MFSSLKTLALVAAAAFLPAIVLAAPTSPAGVLTSPTVPKLPINLLDGCACSSASQIITDLRVTLEAPLYELRCLTAQNATVSTVGPLVAQITTAISASVVQARALATLEVAVIFASVDGTAQITVSELVTLIAALVVDVVGALGFVLSLVSDGAVLGLLCSVGESLAVLLNAFVTVTVSAGANLLALLLAEVGGLGGAVFGVVLQLNVTTLVGAFRSC